jgi:hypothetical protein
VLVFRGIQEEVMSRMRVSWQGKSLAEAQEVIGDAPIHHVFHGRRVLVAELTTEKINELRNKGFTMSEDTQYSVDAPAR